jgi:hypothetical protein
MKVKITIEVPEELKKALLSKAAEEETDLSKVCRRILKRHIAGNLQTRSGSEGRAA